MGMYRLADRRGGGLASDRALGYEISRRYLEKIGTCAPWWRRRREQPHPGGAVGKRGPKDRRDAAGSGPSNGDRPAGVAAIGVAAGVRAGVTATKKQWGNTVWLSSRDPQRGDLLLLRFWDDDFGPAFVKVCAYSRIR